MRETRVLKALGGLGYGFAREWTATELLERPITVVGDLIATKRTGRLQDAVEEIWPIRIKSLDPRD